LGLALHWALALCFRSLALRFRSLALRFWFLTLRFWSLSLRSGGVTPRFRILTLRFGGLEGEVCIGSAAGHDAARRPVTNRPARGWAEEDIRRLRTRNP
jgi:hypothetical protein